MGDVPATTDQPSAPVPAGRGGGLPAGAARMLGKARAGAGRALAATGDALEAGGVAARRVHRRLFLAILALAGLLVLGAVFRALGLLELNYALIALFGLAALWLFLHPAHLAGVVLVGGGVAIADDLGGARGVLLGYARLLARVLLVLLIPLLFFALAPGDRSLGTSLPLLALAPVAGLAVWLFGKLDPRVERVLFVGLPVGALAIVAANMLVPVDTLARIGVPAWLTAERPQDAELARIETLLERRRNEARAAQLRAIAARLEAGQPLSPEDEALVGEARRDRATLAGWVERQYAAVQDRLRALGAPAAAAKPLTPPLPPPGSVVIPDRGWSPPVAVPAGFRLCPGAGRYRTQCHSAGTSDTRWRECRAATAPDRMRFRSRARGFALGYRFVPAAQACTKV